MVKDITVLYHADADGFGSAFAFWKKYGNRARFIKVQYGQPVPEIPADTQELYIVDFSYKRETCIELAERFPLVVILDHHKTAEVELAGLPFAIFDQSKSGCHLAWRYLFGITPVPRILRYVEDRDLWRFDLDKSEEVNLAIASMKEDFGVWDRADVLELAETGAAIRNFRDLQIEPFVRNGKVAEFMGVPAVVVNCTANISETGHKLLGAFPEARMAVMYADRVDGSRSYSLRSRGDFDVSALAQKNGGGGHKAAAGFSTMAPPLNTFS